MTLSVSESYRFCDELSRREAKNFYHAFKMLPEARRKEMSALYAFMRHTDDLADEPATVDAKRTALDGWRTALDRSLVDREHEWPGLPALADMAERRGLPRRYLVDVIDGVEMDLTRTSYDTFDQLYRYCYHVASAVGICCLYVWGFRSDAGAAESLAEANGIALQLTNILRDVREDALNGRIYLPREDLDRFGVSPESLGGADMTPAHRELFAFQATRAADYYEKAAPLADLVDPIGRPVLAVITGIYRRLLDEIVKRDYNVLAGRISVPAWRKGWIMARAWAGRSSRRGVSESNR